MAEAKRPGGLYYMGDDAVDANGNKIEDAPKKPADTPREKQPGSIGVAYPEERLAKAMVTELVGAGVIKGNAPKEDKGREARPATPVTAVGATVVTPSAADRAPANPDAQSQTAITAAAEQTEGTAGASSGTHEGPEKSARKTARKSARKSGGK